MKNLKLFVTLFIGAIVISCSSDDDILTQETAIGIDGQISEKTRAIAGIINGNIVFPDPNFKKALLEHDPKIDEDDNGEITLEEARNVTHLYLQRKNISNLSGIQYFTNLTYLDCYNNQITTLNVSKNAVLKYFYCHNNQLTALDVSENTRLKHLNCSMNNIRTLNLHKNTGLTYLICSNNPLTTLDVHKNTALGVLSCSNNQLTTLDVSKNTALGSFHCDDNQLTVLDVSKNTALRGLYCDNNRLTRLDVRKNNVLRYLKCSKNQLTTLNIKNGSNARLVRSELENNPRLACIEVDDPTAFYLSKWKKDARASYSGDCTPFDNR
ncbi:leucine-rich repeat domain-containing protein [Aquimarina sp. 2304DJ70-9]|uniref:leucine-rich repeat domain-containing protein n=1 Tax=Aquimarina penaris TaxID=3231044 RepID=UPI0034625CA4